MSVGGRRGAGEGEGEGGVAVMDGPIRRRGGAGALIEQCAREPHTRAPRLHLKRTTFSEIIHNTDLRPVKIDGKQPRRNAGERNE